MTKYRNDKPSLQTLRQQNGFTIIELMMATLVFSVIMLVAAGTVVRFTNNFQKGMTQTATQNVARSTVELISQQLQFIGNGDGFGPLISTLGGPSKGYCIQGTQYSYVLGTQLQDQIEHALVERRGMADGCDGQPQNLTTGSVSGKELLGPHMRLARFHVANATNPDGSSNPLLYRVSVKVVYGDDDLLCVTGATSGAKSCNSDQPLANVRYLPEAEIDKLQCKTQKGSQFCAVSDISTTVQRRL